MNNKPLPNTRYQSNDDVSSFCFLFLFSLCFVLSNYRKNHQRMEMKRDQSSSGKAHRKEKHQYAETNREQPSSGNERQKYQDPWATPSERKASDKTWQGKSHIPSRKTGNGKTETRAQKERSPSKEDREKPIPRQLKSKEKPVIGKPVLRSEGKEGSHKDFTPTRTKKSEEHGGRVASHHGKRERIFRDPTIKSPKPSKKMKSKEIESKEIVPTCPKLGAKMITTTPPPPTQPKAQSVPWKPRGRPKLDARPEKPKEQKKTISTKRGTQPHTENKENIDNQNNSLKQEKQEIIQYQHPKNKEKQEKT